MLASPTRPSANYLEANRGAAQKWWDVRGLFPKFPLSARGNSTQLHQGKHAFFDNWLWNKDTRGDAWLKTKIVCVATNIGGVVVQDKILPVLSQDKRSSVMSNTSNDLLKKPGPEKILRRFRCRVTHRRSDGDDEGDKLWAAQTHRLEIHLQLDERRKRTQAFKVTGSVTVDKIPCGFSVGAAIILCWMETHPWGTHLINSSFGKFLFFIFRTLVLSPFFLFFFPLLFPSDMKWFQAWCNCLQNGTMKVEAE